jgi:hypothetical protein
MVTDPTRDPDRFDEVLRGLERQRLRLDEAIAGAVVITVLLLTLAVILSVGQP